MTAFEALAWSTLAGVSFAGAVAGFYWAVRRRDPAARSHAIKIFLVLAVIVAARVYALAVSE